jgi:hypothetical protein
MCHRDVEVTEATQEKSEVRKRHADSHERRWLSREYCGNFSTTGLGVSSCEQKTKCEVRVYCEVCSLRLRCP